MNDDRFIKFCYISLNTSLLIFAILTLKSFISIGVELFNIVKNKQWNYDNIKDAIDKLLEAFSFFRLFASFFYIAEELTHLTKKIFNFFLKIIELSLHLIEWIAILISFSYLAMIWFEMFSVFPNFVSFIRNVEKLFNGYFPKFNFLMTSMILFTALGYIFNFANYVKFDITFILNLQKKAYIRRLIVKIFGGIIKIIDKITIGKIEYLCEKIEKKMNLPICSALKYLILLLPENFCDYINYYADFKEIVEKCAEQTGKE